MYSGLLEGHRDFSFQNPSDGSEQFLDLLHSTFLQEHQFTKQ